MALKQSDNSSYIYRLNIFPDFTNAAEKYTIMAWLNIPAVPALKVYWYSLVNLDNGTQYTSLNGTWDFAVALEFQGSAIINEAAALSAGWHHLAVTYDGVDLTFYLDGVFVATGAKAVVWGPNTPKMYIGTNTSGAIDFGVIDGFAAWKEWLNLALTEEQIAAEMTQYLPILDNCTVCSPFRTIDEAEFDVEHNATWVLVGTVEEVEGPNIPYGGDTGAYEMVETLSAGRTHTVAQTTAYALPPVTVNLQASDACQLSFDSTTGFTTVAATTTGIQTAMPFIRCTTAAATIAVKRL